MTTATVKLWGETVGAVTWLKERNYAAFEYDPAFLKKGLDLSPLYLNLDDARAGTVFSFPHLDRQTFNGLPGLLAHSLPDDFGNRVIEAWLAAQGRARNSFNPVERLCYIGTRGMGALEYVPSIAPGSLQKSAPIEVEKLLLLASSVLEDRSRLDVHLRGSDDRKAEAMLDILRVGVSAGGAVPKAVVAINEDDHIISGQGEIPEGYEHYIIKFDGVSPGSAMRPGRSQDNCRVEYAYSLMARAAGIEMTECRLLEENGRAHFITKRFDRAHNHKIHCLSLACIGHHGWNPIGSTSYEMAFQVMRMLSLPYPEQEQQFRRMVFNAIARNVDDHVKNISYTMDMDGIWHLSPAYDVTFSVNPEDGLGEMHKLSINGKQDNLSREDFRQVAYNMEIKKADRIIDEVRNAVIKWPEFAQEAGVSLEVIDYIGRYHLRGDDLNFS